MTRVSFRPNHPDQSGLVLVERNGDCYLQLAHQGVALIGVSLSPREAVALARRMLDMFGEPV